MNQGLSILPIILCAPEEVYSMSLITLLPRFLVGWDQRATTCSTCCVCVCGVMSECGDVIQLDAISVFAPKSAS